MEGVVQFIRSWNAFLEPYPALRALQVIVLSLVLAAAVYRLIDRILRRAVSRTGTDVDDRILNSLRRPVFNTVALLGLGIAVYEFELTPGLLVTTTAIVRTILIVIWLAFGLRLSGIVLAAMKGEGTRFRVVEQTTEPLLKNAVAVLLFITAAYGILLAWDIEVTGLLASAGIIGFALSFAAQDTLGNLFAGIAILADRPYQIGHYIILDSGERGEVTHIGLRSTRLLTRDDVEVSIPNGVMGAAKIVNEASGVPGRYRIRVSVGIAYGSDIDQAMTVLEKVATDHPEVLEDPEPRVRFRQFGDSSLMFELLCWIEMPAQRGRVTHELNCEVYKAFEEAAIRIPFPQRDLYVKEMPERALP